LLLVAFLLVNAPNHHLSLVLASVFQGDAVNCNNSPHTHIHTSRLNEPIMSTRLHTAPQVNAAHQCATTRTNVLHNLLK